MEVDLLQLDKQANIYDNLTIGGISVYPIFPG